MHRPRLGLLCLCALALCPLAAPGSAQAAATSGFKANLATGPEAKTAAELPAQVLGELEGADGTLLTRLSGLATSVLCTASTLEGVKLEGGGKLTEGGKVTFTGCTVPTPTGCTVHSPGKAIGTIVTNELKGQLQSSGEIKVEPKTAGGALANLIFEGGTCSLPTEVSEPIKGVLWLKDCEGKVEEHLEKHLLVESTTHGKTLFIGSDTTEHLETSLDGSAWAKLGGVHAGLKWGGELSAPEWIMLVVSGGPEAKTAAELPAQVLGELEGADGTLLTRLSGLATSVLCTASTLEGVKLEGGGKLTEGGKVTFTGCTVPTPTGCTVHSPGKAIGTIVTNELKGQLQSSGEIKVEPKTAGGALANLIFEGGTCSLPTEVSEPIKGVLWLKDCEGKVEEHLEKHLLVESTTHGKTLFIGSDTTEHLETSLDGSAWAKLGGVHAGLKWGGELSAPEWIMLVVSGGPEAKTAAELPAQVLGELEGADGTLLTRLSGLATSVLCTASTLEGVKLEGGGKLTEGGKVTFTGCTVPTPTGCTVHSPGKAIGTIVTNELKGQLQSSGEIKVEPKTAGGALANLIFEGGTCSLPTEVSEPIKGVLWLKDCEGKVEEHLEKHLLVESTTHGKTLFIGSDTTEHLETSLDGSAWAKLGGVHAGLKWGGELSAPEWIMLVV